MHIYTTPESLSMKVNGSDNRRPTSDKHLVCAVVLKSGMSNGGHASSD